MGCDLFSCYWKFLAVLGVAWWVSKAFRIPTETYLFWAVLMIWSYNLYFFLL